MKLISYCPGNQHGVGVMVDNSRFISLRRLMPDLPHSIRDIHGATRIGTLKRIAEAIKGNEGDLRLEQVQLDPVIPEPHATWALSLNFPMHIDETKLTTSPDYPQIFQRMPGSASSVMARMRCGAPIPRSPRPSITRASWR